MTSTNITEELGYDVNFVEKQISESVTEHFQEDYLPQIEIPKIIESFEDVNLKDDLLRGIYAYGWDKPSQIQRKGIPAILTGSDVVMQAQSGMGKTGTFSTSVLQLIEENLAAIQAIILLPTRELADQVSKVIGAIGDYLEINFVKCVGRSRVSDSFPYPNRATILIGTPGKICAVLEKTLIKSQPFNLKILVIDEFDKMLEEGFVDTIKQIFSYVRVDTQVVLSSATVNDAVLNISKNFMRDPISIMMKEEELSLDGIRQFFVDCGKEEWKFDTIMDLYNSIVIAQSIVFVNSKKKCNYLEEMFSKRDFTVKSIHGDIEQQERDYIMNEFREGRIRVLLTTDLMARGIDVPGVTLVINYDLPNDNAQYIHRIGRTGRYGKKGSSINLIGNGYEKKLLESIENHYKITIQELPANYTSII